MSRQGAISDSDTENDVLLPPNESESTGKETNTSEPLSAELFLEKLLYPPDDSVLSENWPQGCSLHHTKNQRRILPSIGQNEKNSESEELIGGRSIPQDDQWRRLSGIARKISEIIVDSPVNYNWMFSTDVGIGSKAPPSCEEGKLLYYRFIKYFESNCSQDLVKCLCEKICYVIREEKSKEKMKHFLALFWKRVVREIKNRLQIDVFRRDYTRLLVDILGLLEEDDIQSCIEKLSTITMSMKDFKFHFTGLSYLQLRNKWFPLTDPEKVLRKLLQLLTISSTEEKVSQFYDKLIDATDQEEKFDNVKKRLIFFWKRILSVIENEFNPGEAELSERLLIEITKVWDDTFDGDELSDLVTRIIKIVETLEISFEWTRIFQKKVSLAETTEDDDGRSAFCKFIHRLQMSQGEETVGQFCDELHREISKELVPGATKKRLLVFWKRILFLIEQKFYSGDAEFSEKLLIEIKKTMIDTFKEGSLLASVVKTVLQTLETSEQLGMFDKIFSPSSVVICQVADEKDIKHAYDIFILLLKVDNSPEKVREFRYLLHKSIEENASGDVWKLCKTFWNRVDCFVGQENDDFESGLMDTLEEIRNDTFHGEDISILCGKILKNMKGCINQYNLQQLFHSDVVNDKPLSIEGNRLEYYKFIQRLKSTHSKENVQRFCELLYGNISQEKIAGILPTLLLIFWIRVQCLIADQFSPIRFDFDQKLFPKIIAIMKETFAGDNCLTKISASHACCNCCCVQYAAGVHEFFYKKIYRKSAWLRKQHLTIVDKICNFTCFKIFSLFGFLGVCTVIFIFIYYFDTLIVKNIKKL